MTLDLATGNRAALVVAAVLAVLLWRRDREHRPVAAFFAVQALLMGFRLVWKPTLRAAIAAAGGDLDKGIAPVQPLVGLGRAVGIADLAAWLAWPAGFAALALWCFTRVFPPGPTRRWPALAPVALWLAVVAAVAITYPWHRERYRELYTAAQLAAVLASGAALAPAAIRLWKQREGMTPTALCVGAVVLIEGGSLFGAYVWGLFGAAWDLDRAATSVTYLAVLLIQGGALWWIKR